MDVKKLFSILLRVNMKQIIDVTLSIDENTLTPIISGCFIDYMDDQCMQGFAFNGREWTKFGYHG